MMSTLDITMPMHNLLEYSDNYQDSSVTLYQYKRDEPPEENVKNTIKPAELPSIAELRREKSMTL